MTAIEHEDGKIVIQRVSIIDVLHSCRVCSTIWIDRTGKVHRDYTVRIVVILVAERLSQREAMCSVDAV